jgi:hydrogenase maturation protein HypF
LQIDTAPLIRSVVSDLQAEVPVARISARFHNGMAQMIVDLCQRIAVDRGRLPVALSGGVFQNRYLAERAAKLLRQAGFKVLLHRQVPPNDGGLSLGQAAIAGRKIF